ncbi:coiled-coil domain-containing protein 83-like [Argonauta hians]
MKKEILSTDQEIEDIDKQIEYWKEYETKGQIEDRKEIDKLQKQIKDQHECFDYLQTAWEDRLTNEKSSITDVMTRKLESQKSKATEKVACLMPKHCYLQMKDNDWLRSEIEYRLKEYEERSKSVSELERTNLEIMKRLFELGANDLRLSKDDILNECSEHDDIVTSPSETEIDLSKFIDKLSKEIDVNLDRTVAVYSRPPTSFFLTQDEDSEYLSLGPLDWKLLSVHGRRAPLHDSGPMSEEELFALDDHREEWPVTQQMLNSLKLNK